MNTGLYPYPLTEKYTRWLLAHPDAEYNYRGRHLAHYATDSELADVELSLEKIVRDVMAADDARHAAEAK